MTYPSLVAHQDVTSLLDAAGQVKLSKRWLASFAQPAGISTLTTGSISKPATVKNAGNLTDKIEHKLPSASPQTDSEPTAGGFKILTRLDEQSKPQTVNRSLKGDRVVSATFVRPPEKFNAGRVTERHSVLDPLRVGKKTKLAFVKAKPVREALKVAALFHPKVNKSRPPKPRADLPVVVASLVKESTPNIRAYAPEPKYKPSPFAEVLNPPQSVSLTPKLNKGDHAWAAKPLPMSAFSKRQQQCLAAGVYFEARGEPVKGQAAVAQVILNRVRNPTYPNSICGVVYQNKHWRNRCQFSFACDRIKDRVHDHDRWKIATYVARETTQGRIWLKEVGSSTHYHATYVSPKWARKMKRVGKIGLHIFYRTHQGGWS